MKDKNHNQMTKYITRPSKSTNPKKVEFDMNRHVIDTLNKFEDGPDIVEEVIRNSPIPVPGYVGGATPDPTVPTRAERIAGQKQLEKLAVQPDSRGVFQKAVAADEAAYKKSQQYPNEATPEQVARLAYNMEKSRQMTGGDGRYDKPKAIIKKKKIPEKLFENIFDKNGLRVSKKKTTPTPPLKIKFNTYQPYIPDPPSPEMLARERSFKKLVQDNEDKKQKELYSGLPGLLGGFKR